MYYSYARLSRYDLGFVRLLGVGLANLLFPWARFIVATRRHQLTPIEPTWFQVKVGPFLRNDPDKRTYHNLFIHRAEQISGWRKIRLLSSLKFLPEVHFWEELKKDGGDRIVLFEGMAGHFGSILREHALVRKELLAITRDEHKAGLTHDFGKSISVHVRLGDFLPVRPVGHSTTVTRTPMSWYVQTVTQIRRRLGTELPVFVFSDGKDEELRELLSLPRTRRMTFGSSIGDMLAMSRANVLIASGSTFSMWASYVGRIPIIWPQGQLRQRLYHERPEGEVELGTGESLPEPFLALLGG